MKVKYTIKYRKGQKSKQVTGFIRIPKDLPEAFTSEQAVDFLAEKHNLQDSHPLDIKLHNFTSKNFKYDNAKRQSKDGPVRKDS